jgi:hypothetical protein
MLRPRALAAALACSLRWPNWLAISWAFPALYSIIRPGRKPARLGLDLPPSQDPDFGLSRGFAGAASLLAEIFGV